MQKERIKVEIRIDGPKGMYELYDIAQVVKFAQAHPEIQMRLVSKKYGLENSCPLDDLLDMTAFHGDLSLGNKDVYLSVLVEKEQVAAFLKKEIEKMYSQFNSEKERRLQRASEARLESERREEKKKNSLWYRLIGYRFDK